MHVLFYRSSGLLAVGRYEPVPRLASTALRVTNGDGIMESTEQRWREPVGSAPAERHYNGKHQCAIAAVRSEMSVSRVYASSSSTLPSVGTPSARMRTPRLMGSVFDHANSSPSTRSVGMLWLTIHSSERYGEDVEQDVLPIQRE
jgi:hypothetical protein